MLHSTCSSYTAHVEAMQHMLKDCTMFIKPRFYPQLFQFLMKIITVINRVCAYVRTSAEDDNFPREGRGAVYIMILFNVRVFM